MELENQVAVITGAGSGIGQATALRFAQEGARVALVGRTMEKLERTLSELRRQGGDGLAIAADVAKPEDMERVYQQIEQHYRRLDIVFAHAGINGVWAPIEKLQPEEWRRTIEINLSGTFYTIKYAVPLLKRQGGAIVITSSVNGTRMFSTAGASAYSTSKAGQVALMKMLALELAPHRIRVNAICPGAIDTDVEEHTERRDTEQAQAKPVEYPEGMIPLGGGRPGRPQQVAELVLFLASPRADHITGTPVWIDAGQSELQG